MGAGPLIVSFIVIVIIAVLHGGLFSVSKDVERS